MHILHKDKITVKKRFFFILLSAPATTTHVTSDADHATKTDRWFCLNI